MKTAGLLGGMSYESTIQYYKLINKKINNRLGNLNSAKILLYSFNFEEIEALQRNGEWDKFIFVEDYEAFLITKKENIS